MKYTKEEIFTIPNLMGYFRILMIPVFCWLYLSGRFIPAIIVIIVSSVTDLFDGMIARKFNMVTDLGKMLDPVADKLTHAALAVCLAVRYPLMWILIALMVVKEGFMAYRGLTNIKNGRPIEGAELYGKVCTAYLFVMLIVLILFRGLPPTAVNLLIGAGILIMAITLCLYINKFRQERKKGAPNGQHH